MTLVVLIALFLSSCGGMSPEKVHRHSAKSIVPAYVMAPTPETIETVGKKPHQ
jgi:hypothetical protein